MIPKDDILKIFKSTNALLEGHYKLTSGLHSPNYFQCAKVLQYPNYLQLFCNEISEYFKNSGITLVISPALGGIVVGTEVGRQLNVKTIFAERSEGKMSIRRGFEVKKEDCVLVIEDVVTTGGSVQEVINVVQENGAKIGGVGFIVDRSNGKIKLAENQFSLLQLNVITYQPEDCPLCKQNIPVMKPGSRVM